MQQPRATRRPNRSQGRPCISPINVGKATSECMLLEQKEDGENLNFLSLPPSPPIRPYTVLPLDMDGSVTTTFCSMSFSDSPKVDVNGYTLHFFGTWYVPVSFEFLDDKDMEATERMCKFTIVNVPYAMGRVGTICTHHLGWMEIHTKVTHAMVNGHKSDGNCLRYDGNVYKWEGFDVSTQGVVFSGYEFNLGQGDIKIHFYPYEDRHPCLWKPRYDLSDMLSTTLFVTIRNPPELKQDDMWYKPLKYDKMYYIVNADMSYAKNNPTTCPRLLWVYGMIPELNDTEWWDRLGKAEKLWKKKHEGGFVFIQNKVIVTHVPLTGFECTIVKDLTDLRKAVEVASTRSTLQMFADFSPECDPYDYVHKKLDEFIQDFDNGQMTC